MNYADFGMGTWHPKGGMYEVIKATFNTICITSDCLCGGVVNTTIKMSPYTSSQVDPGRTGTRAGRSERLCETKLST